MQFRSWAREEGKLYSRKAARWRDARSGGLNRKRQRTSNDFTPLGNNLNAATYLDELAGLGGLCSVSCNQKDARYTSRADCILVQAVECRF
jgi:hypothetical protein